MSSVVRKYFVPSVLPRKRITLLILAILLSAAIMGASMALLLGISKSTSDFLTPADNVVIISNPKATTPFTSSVPLAMIETIKQIDGVEAMSPEILLVGTSESYSVIGRGVSIQNFTKFNDFKVIKGTLPQNNDSVGVALGYRLAHLLDLDVGDTFTFSSALKNFDYDFKVIGIYSSNNYLDDEFLVSLVSAIPLSNVGPTSVSHIEVKLDTNVISKEEFQKIVFSAYTLQIYFYPLNGTKNDDDVLVTIREKSGRIITSKTVKASEYASFRLVFGTYNVSVELVKNRDDSYQSFTVNLKENETYAMGVGVYLRDVSFNFIAGNKELTTGTITFYNEIDSSFVLTEKLPLLKILIPEGKYLVKYSYGINTLWGHVRVKGVSPDITVQMKRVILNPSILSPLPNVYYSEEKIPLMIVGGPSEVFYRVDNETIQKYLGPITLELSNGNHKLTIYYNDSLFAEYVEINSFNFSINTSLSPIIFDTGVAVEKNVFININKTTSTGIKGRITLPLKQFSVYLENIALTNNTENLSFESGVHKFTTGIYKLTIVGTFYNGTEYKSTFNVQISNEEFFVQGLYNKNFVFDILPGITLSAYLPLDIIKRVYLNNTLVNWGVNFVQIPSGLYGIYELNLLLSNNTIIRLGYLKLVFEKDLSPIIFSLADGTLIEQDNNIVIDQFPAAIIFQSHLYAFTEWYVSTDNSTWYLFDGIMIIDALNKSTTSFFVKYRTLWGFSPTYNVNISSSNIATKNRLVLLRYVNEGAYLTNLFGDGFSVSVRPSHYSTSLSISFSQTNTSFFFHALVNENLELLFEDGGLLINFVNITGFNPFINEYTYLNSSFYSISSPLSVKSPMFITPGDYFSFHPSFKKLSLVHVLPSCNAKIIGPLFVPSDHTLLSLIGSYAGIEPLTSTDPSIIISIKNGTVFVGNLSVSTTITFKIFSQANTSESIKLTITPFSENVTFELSIFERGSGSPIEANVSIIYQDDGSTLNFTNVNTLNISLRKGNILLIVYYDHYVTTTSIVLMENMNFSIQVGKSLVSLNVINPNTWANISGYYLSIKQLGYPEAVQLKYVSSSIISIYLDPGTYIFEVQWLTRTGSAILTVTNEQDLTIQLEPLLTNITIKIEGTDNIPKDARIVHLASGKVFYPTKIENGSLVIVFENVYQGSISVVLQGEDYTKNIRFSVYMTSYSLTVEIIKTNTVVDAKDLLKLANSLDYSLTNADSYLNSFISGPLELIKTVFFAEVILVMIVIMANVISVMRGIISESKNEIFVLKSMGANQIQIFIGSMRQGLFWGFFSALFGTGLGVVISLFLVKINSIRIFSHSFSPVFNIQLLLLNTFSTLILYSLGFFVAYKEEIASS